MTTAVDKHRTTGSSSAGSARTWLSAVRLGTVATTVVNLLVLALGRATDASLTYVDDGATSQVGVGDVVFASALPLALGTGLAALLALRWAWMTRLAQVVGGALALLTIAGPLSMDTDGGTRLVLSVMHVVVAVAVVAILEVGRRRAGHVR